MNRILIALLFLLASNVYAADITISTNGSSSPKTQNGQHFLMVGKKLVVYAPRSSSGVEKFWSASSTDNYAAWIGGDSNGVGTASTQYGDNTTLWYIGTDTITAGLAYSTATRLIGNKYIVRNDSVKRVLCDTLATCGGTGSFSSLYSIIAQISANANVTFIDTASGAVLNPILSDSRWSSASVWNRGTTSTFAPSAPYRPYAIGSVVIQLDSTLDFHSTDGSTWSSNTGGTDILLGLDGRRVENVDIAIRGLNDSVFFLTYDKADSIAYKECLLSANGTVSVTVSAIVDTPSIHGKRGDGGYRFQRRCPQVGVMGNRVYVAYKWWHDTTNVDSVAYVYKTFTIGSSTQSALDTLRPATGADTLCAVEIPPLMDTTGTVILPMIWSDSAAAGAVVWKSFIDTVTYGAGGPTYVKKYGNSVLRKVTP